MDIAGSKALVTGATGGLGIAIATALAGAGAEVTVSGRRADVLDELAARIAGRAVVCDLARPADLARLVDEAGPIDVLIANAALPASGPLLDYEADEIDRAIDVNLRAPIQLARAAAPGMVGRGRGHLVLVSSLSGLSASPSSSLYSATKFGLRGFAHGLRQDLHGTGVGVSVVLPGFIRDAGMFADSGASLPRGIGTRTPDEVASAVLNAIRKDRAEVTVAPPTLAVGAYLGGMFPSVGAGIQRRAGGAAIAAQVAEGQRRHR